MKAFVSLNSVLVFAAVAAQLVTTSAGRADEPKPAAKENQLVGTWKLVSAKWGGREAPTGGNRLKYVTPTRFIWVYYGDDGEVRSSLGGPYKLDGDKYEETPEFGVGPVLKELKGKVQSFKWKVDGNKWYHTGELSGGLTIEEVWERVEKR